MSIIDTSSDTTTKVECLKSNGVSIIFRYYATNTTSWKVMQRPEAQAISNAGMEIGVVFENGNNLNSFTEIAGYKDAMSAFKYASETIQQPINSAIYFAIDCNVTDSQIESNIVPYFQGIKKGFQKSSKGNKTYKVGAYGCGAVVNSLLDIGLCELRWLSQSTSYNGTTSALKNGLYELTQQYEADDQICTIAVDRNEIQSKHSNLGIFRLQKE